jgi:hypothetical protein
MKKLVLSQEKTVIGGKKKNSKKKLKSFEKAYNELLKLIFTDAIFLS